MFQSNLSPTNSYQRVHVETGIDGSSPHKLILMLYDGAIFTLNTAAIMMRENNIPKKGLAISRAMDIILFGLKASLNLDEGGELAERLAALYDYMSTRLLYANLKNDQSALQEIINLLTELRSAWQEIADDPAVLSANKAAA
jgi:flagellar protein FliS